MGKTRSVIAGALTLALVGAGCGRSDDSDTSATTVPTTTAAATTPAASDGTTPSTDESSAAPPTTSAARPDGYGLTAADIADACAAEAPAATDIGVSADTITIEVMADTGSPLAPGLFQANVDAVTAYADWVNANGGLGCRQLAVRTWDSKIDPSEAKNGVLDACANAFAMVGGNSLFNPDPVPFETCADQAGAPTGLPNVAALATDVGEMCAATTFTVQYQAEKCPIADGVRDFTSPVGAFQKVAELHPGDLHGVFLVPGDLPSSRQSAMPGRAAQESVGITFDATLPFSGRDAQSLYTQRVRYLREGSNYVYNGGNQTTQTLMMKEAIGQGVDPESVVWMCSLACYSRDLLTGGGSAVEGTYTWMEALPFEEADTNAALGAYVDSVGIGEVTSFGAQAWQAAMAFTQVVNQLVAEQGPNAVTRANLLAGLAALDDFSADGWSGERSLRGSSPCFVLLQVQGGEFVRVWPEERGTLDCEPDNLAHVSLDPVAQAAALG